MSDKNTLDHIILYCHQYNLGDQNIHDIVSAGQFDFRCRSHSTGNSLECWVWNKERTEKREIINTTYWFRPRYCFNNSIWESGAWDRALVGAINQLKEKVREHKELAEQEEKARKDRAHEVERLKKLEFEKQFI